MARQRPLPLSWLTQSVTISPDAPQGLLAYPLLRRNADAKTVTYSVELCEISSKSDLVPQNFPLVLSGDYSPLASAFSPNGALLFLEFAEYSSVIWNIKTHQTQQGPAIRGYPNFLWSPDSQHIAFFQGGDEYGHESFRTQPLTLFVFDVRSRESRQIAHNPGVGSLAWTRQGSLLYTFWPNEAESLHSAVYTIPADGGAPRELIPNASAPSPSPDGQWVTFVGWGNGENMRQGSAARQSSVLPFPTVSPRRNDVFGLYLFNAKDRTRRLVRPLPPQLSPENETVIWMPDSRSFIVVDHRYQSTRTSYTSENFTKIFPAHGKVSITQFTIAPWQEKAVTTLSIDDDNSRVDDWIQVRVDGFSHSGRWLYLETNEFKVMRPPFYAYQRVDLSNGSVKTIFSGEGVREICWRESPGNR